MFEEKKTPGRPWLKEKLSTSKLEGWEDLDGEEELRN
jgi:hypothetical protein